MPYDEDGKFYTTRLEDDLAGDDALGRLVDRALNARKAGGVGGKIGSKAGSFLGPVGGFVGGVLGGTLGGISGFILGDQETVFPIDMIAIPAYQAYLLSGTPAFQIFIKEGEVLTQVQLTDAQESAVIVATDSTIKRKRAKGAGLPKKYAKMGFKKGWREYKKTPGYKRKQASKKKKGGRKR